MKQRISIDRVVIAIIAVFVVYLLVHKHDDLADYGHDHYFAEEDHYHNYAEKGHSHTCHNFSGIISCD